MMHGQKNIMFGQCLYVNEILYKYWINTNGLYSTKLPKHLVADNV